MSDSFFDDEALDQEVEKALRPPFLRAGNHILRIDSCSKLNTKKKGAAFCIDYTVIESDSHEPGERVVQMVMKSWPSFSRTVANFVQQADPGNEDLKQAVKDSVGEDQPLAGRIIKAIAEDVTTGNGGNFTVVNYQRTSQEQAAA